MKYIVFNKNKPIVHCESGIAKSEEIFHIKRNMPMTELMIMVSGKLHIKHLENYVLEKNDVFILPQNILHYGTKKSTFTIHWFHLILPNDFRIVEDNEIESIDQETNYIIPILIRVNDPQNLITMAYQLEQYQVSKATQDIRNALIKAIFLEIMLQQSDSIHGKFVSHKRLNSIINFINSNIEHPLVVKDLSDKFGYNEKYIFNLFKRYLNTSPLQYIIQQKMQLARTLLLSTDNTIEAISSAVGYSNSQYFMRLFKQVYNCTPTEFRKSYSHSLELFYSSKQ